MSAFLLGMCTCVGEREWEWDRGIKFEKKTNFFFLHQTTFVHSIVHYQEYFIIDCININLTKGQATLGVWETEGASE